MGCSFLSGNPSIIAKYEGANSVFFHLKYLFRKKEIYQKRNLHWNLQQRDSINFDLMDYVTIENNYDNDSPIFSNEYDISSWGGYHPFIESCISISNNILTIDGDYDCGEYNFSLPIGLKSNGYFTQRLRGSISIEPRPEINISGISLSSFKQSSFFGKKLPKWLDGIKGINGKYYRDKRSRYDEYTFIHYFNNKTKYILKFEESLGLCTIYKDLETINNVIITNGVLDKNGEMKILTPISYNNFDEFEFDSLSWFIGNFYYLINENDDFSKYQVDNFFMGRIK